MNEVMEYLKSCGTFYLATSEEGQAHVRPFGAVCALRASFISSRTIRKTYIDR